MRPRALSIIIALVVVHLTAATAAAAPSITEYLTADQGANGIAQGPNGDTWFTLTENPGGVGRVTPLGGMTLYRTAQGLTNDAKPAAITAGPGGMWFTETGKNKIGRITEAGAITEFLLGPVGKPTGIAHGPDGNLWYTAVDHHSGIGRLTPGGVATEFTAGLTPDSKPQDITRGPDGALWFTEPGANRIGRITTQGVITEFATGAVGGTPREIVAGPDGNLWFTLPATTPAIGRITPQGGVTLFTAGLPLGSAPEGIAVGGDGNLHFTDNGANAVGVITPQGAIAMTSAGITANSDLRSIAAGSDGAMWFGEYRGALGRVTVAPRAETVAVSDVTSAAAVLTGSVKPNAQATNAHIEWGATTAYGQTTPSASMGISGSTQTFSAPLSGLAPSTTYHARVVAVNATGTTYGPDRTFTTTALNAPSATTQEASGIGDDHAILNATVDPEGNPTTYRFEWGTSTAYGAQVPLVEPTVGSDSAGHAVSQPLAGLEPNTTYHFRVVATSGVATTHGADRTFTTDVAAPVVAAVGASSVTATGATLNGAVNPRNSATAYRFDWGTTNAYGNSAPAVEAPAGSDDATHAVAEGLTGLDPNTTYHFRLVATSAGGTDVGANQTFTTPMTLPLVTTTGATGIDTDEATLSGTVDPRNALTITWFEWGETAVYGTATPPVTLPAIDLQAHPVSRSLTGLQAGRTYHFRAVASSGAGIAYGPDQQLTTSPAPVDPPEGEPPVDPPAGDAPPVVAPAAGTTPDPSKPGDPRPLPGPSPDRPEGPAPAAVPLPELGRSVVAGVTSGTVSFRAPGGSDFSAISGADAIPSGSIVDARRGTLVLVSALDGAGRTQRATFRGARFRVVQKPGGNGMVDLYLREAPVGCGRGKARAAAKRRKRARSLWGTDDRGRYTTHGRTSAATTRGTRWVTTETCRGTRTRVLEGSVAVRNLRSGKRVVVRAGGTHLARR